jgi:hypothetical protein
MKMKKRKATKPSAAGRDARMLDTIFNIEAVIEKLTHLEQQVAGAREGLLRANESLRDWIDADANELIPDSLPSDSVFTARGAEAVAFTGQVQISASVVRVASREILYAHVIGKPVGNPPRQTFVLTPEQALFPELRAQGFKKELMGKKLTVLWDEQADAPATFELEKRSRSAGRRRRI